MTVTAPPASALAAAHEQGQEAGRAGARVDTCPHRPRTAAALTAAWLNGYAQGRRSAA